MPKQPSKEQSASIKLLDINGKLHELMAQLEVEKSVNEGIAVIPVTPIKTAYVLASDAINTAENAGQHGELLDSVNKLREVIGKVLDSYKETDGKLTMPAEVASDLNALILNYLANKIHDIAMNLIGATGQVQACSVSKVDPEEAATVAKYCSGVLPQIGNAVVTKVPLKHITIGDKKVVQHYPTNIVHKLGIHKVEVSTHTAGDNPLVAIEYHDSGPQYHDSKTRLQGVNERLKKEGLECFPKYPNLYCSGEFDKDKLTQLASFFSLLLNADIAGLGKDTVPVVSNATWDYAGELAAKYGDDTWKSGQGQLNWQSMYNKMVEEKELMEKSKIYGDLKQLAIYRDKHHELEEALGVDTGKHASPKAVKDIVSNADKAVALCEKNKWASGSLGTLKGSISSFKDSGSGNASDAVGNMIHNILIDELQALGNYGGCPVNTSLPDINAGALSYCEGTLKGTSAILEGGGSQPLHKVAPKQYKSIIIDENPEGGYDVHIPLDPGFWSQELADYLDEKFGFDCKSQGYGKWKAGSVCNVHIDSHDKIRLLAIFLSNLKGGSDEIGTECVPKAMEVAFGFAEKQAQKGSMAFNQVPMFETSKQWIDMCYKGYGIMPPGLTQEQKIILELLGADKLYAGCDLSTEELVPNMGILNYCEGVRVNPQANISAYLSPTGYLQHFFHQMTDKLADVFINPMSEGQYLVEVNNIDMRDPALTKEVVSRLNQLNYTCKGYSCQKEIGEKDIRWLAMFLSSLHQAYKLEPSQIPKAVNLAIKKIEQIPNDKNAYKNKVYPWTQEDWVKELGKPPSKAVKPPEEEGAVLYPVTEEGYPEINWDYINSLPTSGTPPWVIGGCKSNIKAGPTKIKAGYCAGILDEFANSENKIVTSGTSGTLSSKENTQHILGFGNIVFDSKFNTLYITLPDSLAKIQPVLNTLETKFMFENTGGNTWTRLATPKLAALVAYFFSHLHNVGELPPDCWQEAVEYAYAQSVPPIYKMPVYPFNKSDWLKDICGEEKPGYALASMNKAFQAQLTKDICELKGDGADITQVFDWFSNAHPDITFGANTKVILLGMYDECPEKKIPSFVPEGFAWLPPFEKMVTSDGTSYMIPKAHIVEKVKSGLTKAQIIWLLQNDEVWAGPGTDYGAIENFEHAKEIAEAYFVEDTTTDIDKLIDKQNEVLKKVAADISADIYVKCSAVTAYKKLPKKCKDHIHALMNLKLLQGYANDKSYEEILKEVQVLVKDVYPGLTPLMIKLQLDIEKKNKIRKGELPAEPGEKVAHTYEELSEGEKESVNDAIKEALEEVGEGNAGMVDSEKLAKEAGIANEPSLWSAVNTMAKEMWPGEKVDKSLSEDSPAELKNEVMNFLKGAYDAGMTKESALIYIVMQDFGFEWSEYLDSFVSGWLSGYQQEEDKSDEKKYYPDLKPAVKKLVDTFITEKAAKGKGKIEIGDELAEHFNLYITGDMDVKIGKEVESYQKLLEKTTQLEKAFESLDPLTKKEKKESEVDTKSDELKQQMRSDILKMMEEGLSVKKMQTWIAKEYNLVQNQDLNNWVQNQVSELSAKYPDLKEEPGEIWPEHGQWPTLNDYIIAEPQTAQEMLELVAHLINQNKYSSNEIAEAVSSKYKVVNDDEFKQWLIEIHKYQAPQVMFGNKYEELDADKKKEVDEYIQLQSDYRADVIEEFVYGTHGVMPSDALMAKINEIKGIYGEEEDDMLWYFVVYSEAYGNELYGPYDTEKEALAGINNVKEKAKGLKDEVERKYSHPFQGGESQIEYLVESDYEWDEEEEEEEPTHKRLEDFPDEEIDKILIDIKNYASQGMDFDHILEQIEEDYNLEDSSYLAEAIEGMTVNQEIMKENYLEELKQQVIHQFYDMGLSTPNIIYSLYAAESEMVDVNPAQFKSWVTNIIKKYNEEQEKAKLDWNTATDEQKKKAAAFVNLSLDDNKSVLEIYNELLEVGWDEKTLPTVKDISAWEPEEKISYEDITTTMVHDINMAVEGMIKSGAGHHDIFETIVSNYNLADDTSTNDWLAVVIDKKAEQLETEEELPEGLTEAMETAGIEIPIEELKSWYDMSELEQYQFAKAVKDKDIVGWDELKEIAMEYGITPDEDEIPSVVELVEIAMEKATISELYEEKMKEEYIPSQEHIELYEETMKTYIQMGWTPQALIEFFTGKMSGDILKKTANKLYKLYKPDVIRGGMTIEEASTQLVSHLKNIASKLLEEGKSIADTAWYISTNYAFDKTSVREMVKKVAEKPLSQVEAAVKALQLIATGDYIGGCQVEEPMDQLTAQNVSYCQGVLEKKATLNEAGSQVYHKMGTQVVTTKSTSDLAEWMIELNYDETAEVGSWKDRIKGVNEILQEMGFNCYYEEPDTFLGCKLTGEDGAAMPILEQDRVRKAALFLSSVDNVSQLEAQCVPYALKYAAEAAKKKNETSQPWTVGVFPKEVQDWNTIVCSKILA